MRKSILMIVCLVAGISGGAGLGFGVMMPMIETHNWEKDYNDLLGDYNALTDDYENLIDDYNDLLNDYNNLFSDFELLRQAFEDPLTNPVIPTISQVQSWLATDDTDDMLYNDDPEPIWICGDFSAMLMVRAKAMNWRMRIAIMFWSFDDEGGYGNDNDPYGSHGHAFCCIETPDDDNSGDLDLIYIEPQTDAIWSVHNNNHFQIWTYYHFTAVPETMWYETYFWTNHYTYFA